ncbi:MAG: SCO family protein [Chloroflexota bacterium]
MNHVKARRRGFAVGLLAAIAAVALVGCREEAPDFASAVADPPAAMPAFELVAEDGSPFRLADLQGRVAVVYVGYTFCPDMCPLTMSLLAEAVDLLPAEVRDGVQVVMLTADPERDTPERTGEYVAYFDPEFLGVSGDPDAVHEALASWGIHPEHGPVSANGGYAVSHPTRTYVFNREGLLRLYVPHDLPAQTVADDLELVWREGND